ncbi:hypothetical protein JS81_00665 [Thermoactinomyces sp. Gus2-1]|jgi:hypothetical protein|nr:hypothetical protein JS81_00665 [Thermoactinomyces sp. Gus2-1]
MENFMKSGFSLEGRKGMKKGWTAFFAFWLVVAALPLSHSLAQDAYSIRCSVGFDEQSERYYVYARLTVGSGDQVEGSWYYFDREHNQSFREIGDRDVSFLKIGNDAGKTAALLKFDGIINRKPYILEENCTFTREGIRLQVSPSQEGIRASGEILYGSQAAGKWHFQIFDQQGQEKASIWLRQNGETASHRFEALPPGAYQAQLTFDGTINGDRRILRDAYSFQVSPESSSPASEDEPGLPDSGPNPSQSSSTPFFFTPVAIFSVVALGAGIIIWIVIYRKM